MEKNVKVSMLCQIYGKMLTEKQYQVINDYYNNDLSLSEIAENNNITRQAVRDIIKKIKGRLKRVSPACQKPDKIPPAKICRFLPPPFSREARVRREFAVRITELGQACFFAIPPDRLYAVHNPLHHGSLAKGAVTRILYVCDVTGGLNA